MIPKKIQKEFQKLSGNLDILVPLVLNSIKKDILLKSTDSNESKGPPIGVMKHPIIYLCSIPLASDRNVLISTQANWRMAHVEDVDVITYQLDRNDKLGMMSAVQDTIDSSFAVAGFIINVNVNDEVNSVEGMHAISAFSCPNDILICNSWGSPCQFYDDFEMKAFKWVFVVMVRKHPPP